MSNEEEEIFTGYQEGRLFLRAEQEALRQSAEYYSKSSITCVRKRSEFNNSSLSINFGSL
jgi:hypothetical protein